MKIEMKAEIIAVYKSDFGYWRIVLNDDTEIAQNDLGIKVALQRLGLSFDTDEKAQALVGTVLTNKTFVTKPGESFTKRDGTIGTYKYGGVRMEGLPKVAGEPNEARFTKVLRMNTQKAMAMVMASAGAEVQDDD